MAIVLPELMGSPRPAIHWLFLLRLMVGRGKAEVGSLVLAHRCGTMLEAKYFTLTPVFSQGGELVAPDPQPGPELYDLDRARRLRGHWRAGGPYRAEQQR